MQADGAPAPAGPPVEEEAEAGALLGMASLCAPSRPRPSSTSEMEATAKPSRWAAAASGSACGDEEATRTVGERRAAATAAPEVRGFSVRAPPSVRLRTQGGR